jgi:CPA1 family monovalent cation:H+ antiporter
MEQIWLPVLGLIFILTLAALLLPVANKMNFPHTVLLAVVGILLGLLTDATANFLPHGFLMDASRSLSSIHITADMVMFVFLPALVFESALSIDVQRLLEDIGPILFLAIIGLLISTIAVALPLHWITGMGLVVCLLLGCIVSATDPVAVVALFKELGAPKRLNILVEGESLFNDATAIVLYTILVAMVLAGGEANVLGGLWEFLRVFAGGIIVGYIAARIFAWIIERLRKQTLVCITLTITLAYFSFIVAEHYLHVSGVMAVVAAGLVMGSVGRTALSPDAFHALHETWGQLGFWAISIIFVLVGLAVPELLAAIDADLLIGLVVVIAATSVARAMVIYGLMPIVSALRVGQKVSVAFRTVMVWGGLRGAVSLALALAVFENAEIGSDTRQFIAVLVTGFVLFTLFVQATTIRHLMAWFGLNELTPRDQAIRDRAMAQTLANVTENAALAIEGRDIEDDFIKSQLKDYERRVETANEKAQAIKDMTETDWITVGLATYVAQEKSRYFNLFGQGFLSVQALRQLVIRVEDIADALRARGIEGYEDAVERSFNFNRQFHGAVQLQRRTGWSKPLARALALRFEVQSAMRDTIRAELDTGESEVRAIVGDAADKVLELMRQRLEAVTLSVASIRLQYPEYVHAVEKWNMIRFALRVEQLDYRRLLDKAIISQDIFDDLMAGIGSRTGALTVRPRLDLSIDTDTLVRKVPFLAQLAPDRISVISKMLKPYVTIPSETVITKGETGSEMYFISSGCLQVELEDQNVQLGSGDIFGEIALLSEVPRTANVKSLGFCELLMLDRRDFIPFLNANKDLKAHIKAVAAERHVQ